MHNQPGDHGGGGEEDEERHPRVGDVVGGHLVPCCHHRSVLLVLDELDQGFGNELWAHEATNVSLHLGDLFLGAAG